jgi:ABC-type multidrug transport system fused ATPase/permease subunit
VTLLSILLGGGIALQLASPQLLRSFIDLATSGQGAGVIGRLAALALLFMGMALVQQLLTVWSTYVSEKVAWDSTNALRNDLARHCVDLDMSFHNEHRPGELIERIDGDVASLANFFSQLVIQVLGNALLMLGVIAMLALEDLRLGGAMALFGALALLLLYRVSAVAVPRWDAARQAAADMSGYLEERLAGTEDIRSSGATAYVLQGFDRQMRSRWRAEMKAGLMVNLIVNSSMLLFAVGNAAAFALGAWLYLSQRASLGSVFLIFQYSNVLFMPIERISQQLGDLQKAGAGIERIRTLRERKSRISFPPPGSGKRLPAGGIEVGFDRVTFGYDPKEPVLHEVDLRLGAGRVLGLLGRTGSGKTSIARLLFRLYDPQQGCVRVGSPGDPVDIRELGREELHRRIGMVTQEVQLFAASIRDNLTLFDTSADDTRLVAAIDGLGLREWYDRLPQGLDTPLASGGTGLSAGEAQLLALLRIFLTDPGLVILDEASSRLDPATERLIERALDALCQSRTTIVIAHRLATVRRADEIAIVEQGRIVENGSRAALEADPGSRFSGLLRTGLEEVLA